MGNDETLTIYFINKHKKIKLMWDSIFPVTNDHDPIVAEGTLPIQCWIFNAGPGDIETQVWSDWGNEISIEGKILDKKQPDFKLELRPGNQRFITGSFLRLGIKKSDNFSKVSGNNEFAAVGIRIINSNNTIDKK